MPAASTSDAPLTSDDFLAWEEQQEERHEFIAGEVHAMTGASFPHKSIVLNLFRILDAALDPEDCVVLDETVQFRFAGELFYPDLMVTCEEYRPGREWFESPVLLAEVLSPSTQRRDRSLKMSRYQRVPSLQTFLLVAQHRPWVQVMRRVGDGWVATIHESLDDVIEVTHPACRIALRDVYRRVPMMLG